MASFSGVIRSKVLAMDTMLNVILPYDRPAEGGQQEPCKVLYLLHGLGDNAMAWTRYTAIETYARQYGIAVVMPEVQRSFYFDMAHGMNYFTYITLELPDLCSRMFHISDKRADTYVAGLSMGGYGALKCGLINPRKYQGCASFSGAVDIVRIIAEYNSGHFTEEFQAVLGMNLQILEQDNLLIQAERISHMPPAQQPDILVTCGSQDFLCAINRSFRNQLAALPLKFTYREWPGIHNWAFWDESIRLALRHWLGPPPEAVQRVPG